MSEMELLNLALLLPQKLFRAMDTWCNSRTARNRGRTSDFPSWFLGPSSTRPLELERSLGTRLPAGFKPQPCHRLLAVWKRQTVMKTRAVLVSGRLRAQATATPAGDFASKLNWIKVTLKARSMDRIFQWEYMKQTIKNLLSWISLQCWFQGRGPGGRPLIFKTGLKRRPEKKMFLRPAPSALSQGLDDRPLPYLTVGIRHCIVW